MTTALPQVLPGTLTSINIGTGIGADVNQLEAKIRQSVAVAREMRGQTAEVPEPEYGPARPGDLRSEEPCAGLTPGGPDLIRH